MKRRVKEQYAVSHRPGAHSGQILILFAVFSTAMFGVLGLATDLGVSFAGRRSVQNAADAAAYAGARVIAHAATTSGMSAQSEVDTLARENGFKLAPTGPAVQSCQYVDDSEKPLGPCSWPVPIAATGVTVTVAETHPTYFIRLIPGSPKTVTTRATATAHVRILTLTAAGPFIPCATGTVLTPPDKENGSKTMDILIQGSGKWQINRSAVNRTFNIHEPNPHDFNKCGITNSAFKGIADTNANASLTAPPAKYFGYATGDVASISTSVQGIQGCQVGQPLDNCVAYLPIATVDLAHPAIDSGSNKQVWTIGFAAFLITQTGSNSHSGKLLSDYIVKGPAGPGWTPRYFGPIAVKLTG